MITKYGLDVVATVVAVVVLCSLMVWFFVDGRGWRLGLFSLLTLTLIFTVSFFRDPARHVPEGKDLIISPADGKVVLIKEVDEPEYLKARATQVSIFMSPLNVHVNRFPVSGRVAYFKHIPGEFMVAFDAKSSERNERTHIGIESGNCRILMKQIAGFVARRIVAPLKVGDEAVAGERFGMIRFGSRVDIIIPLGSTIEAQLGDKSVAGETILATAPPTPDHLPKRALS